MLIAPKPAAYFEPGAIQKLPDIVRGTGADTALIVTDAALAKTPVIATVTGVLDAAGIPVRVFDGVHPNPTTDDVAVGAALLAESGVGGERVALVAVGGGSPIDAAKLVF
jgi:alcohol dehydrogenase class IV